MGNSSSHDPTHSSHKPAAYMGDVLVSAISEIANKQASSLDASPFCYSTLCGPGSAIAAGPTSYGRLKIRSLSSPIDTPSCGLDHPHGELDSSVVPT